jgi:FtsP/CotA-like multicopper oxidase with cupredoxin domain
LAIGLTLPLPNGDYRRCLAESTGPTDIDGRAATFWGLVNAQGGSGLTLDPGQQFRVDLSNALDVDTIIHWHGQIPPNAQDGVPDIPLPMLKREWTEHGGHAARFLLATVSRPSRTAALVTATR